MGLQTLIGEHLPGDDINRNIACRFRIFLVATFLTLSVLAMPAVA